MAWSQGYAGSRSKEKNSSWREGDAIAWHIATELKDNNDDIKRVTFTEITKNNILKNIANPRSIDMQMVHSQQARRVMDRLIGFKISSFASNALVKNVTTNAGATTLTHTGTGSTTVPVTVAIGKHKHSVTTSNHTHTLSSHTHSVTITN